MESIARFMLMIYSYIYQTKSIRTINKFRLMHIRTFLHIFKDRRVYIRRLIKYHHGSELFISGSKNAAVDKTKFVIGVTFDTIPSFFFFPHIKRSKQNAL